MLNELFGENGLKVLKNSSVIGAMTEIEIIKNTNIISPCREPNIILPVLTVTDVGRMKVPEIKKALSAKGALTKRVERGTIDEISRSCT